MKRYFLLSLSLLGMIVFVAGCGNKSATTSSSGTTAAGTAPSTADAGGHKKFYWVQTPKGLPVHQMTQLAFEDECKKLGYDCEVIGTDTPDIAGTISLAEQALAKGDAAGFSIWAGSPAFNPLIDKLGKAHVPVVLPHFPVPEGSIPGATGVISCDPAAYAVQVADMLGKAINGKGKVALTQGDFNSTENLVSETFTKRMKEKYPQVNVLPPQKEGFDANQAIATAVSIIQANPDLVAALSTTGGGATTWAGAQKQTNKKLIAVSMDYTRVNLDLVKNGEIYAVVGQPIWEESAGAADLLDKAVKGQKIPWWTKLPAPLITKDNEASYYALLDKAEASMKK